MVSKVKPLGLEFDDTGATGAAKADASNIPAVALTDKVRSSERSRGAGFYDTIRLSADDIDVLGTTDMRATLQGFINTAQAAGKWLQLPGGYAQIRLDSSLTANHGRNAPDQTALKFRLDGNGATLRPTMADFAVKIVPLCDVANAGLGYAIADLGITDLTVDLVGNASAKALLMGATGKVLDGFKYEEISGLLVQQANVAGVIEMRGTVRHLQVVNVVQRELGGLLLNSTNADGFIGDIQMLGCEFKGDAMRSPFRLVTTAPGAQIRGLTVQGDIYGSGTHFDLGAGGHMGDVWFDGVQWDGPDAPDHEDAIAIDLALGSQLYDVFFNKIYGKNYRGRFLRAYSSGGSSTNIQFNGGIIGEIDILGGVSAAVYALNFDGLHFDRVQFRDLDAADAINFDGAKDSSVEGCRLGRRAGNATPAPDHLVTIGNAATNYSITNNIAQIASGADAAVVNDYSSGSPVRIVANNKAAA